MLEQTPPTVPAALPAGLVDAVAHAPATGAPGCLCARDDGGVTELWWSEEGACPLPEQAVDLPASPDLAAPAPRTKQPLPPAAFAPPVQIRIDSFIPSELLLAALASLGPTLESFDWYGEHLLDPDFEARFALALHHSAPTLRRLRLAYNIPLELLPADLPLPPHPSLSPLYQRLPAYTALESLSTTCTRFFAPGAFAFLPPALRHLRIEVMRPCAGMSLPEAVLEAFRNGGNGVKALRTVTVVDDDGEGWEGWEEEIVEAARARGVAFERIGESEMEGAAEEEDEEEAA